MLTRDHTIKTAVICAWTMEMLISVINTIRA